MAAAIQRLARQALVTFMCKESAEVSSNFERLKAMLDSITAEDINLSLSDSSDVKRQNGQYTEAPVSHIPIFECPFFTLGVFILKKECSIPLHDHPGMFGLCKVVCGKILVQSYDKQSEVRLEGLNKQLRYSPLKRRKSILCRMSEHTFDENSGSCVLTPTAGNYHRVCNISQGPSAFVDILAPPYAPEKGRDCTYYMECEPPSYGKEMPFPYESDDSIRWLIEIPHPREFYCDSQPYKGPPVDLQRISVPLGS